MNNTEAENNAADDAVTGPGTDASVENRGTGGRVSEPELVARVKELEEFAMDLALRVNELAETLNNEAHRIRDRRNPAAMMPGASSGTVKEPE